MLARYLTLKVKCFGKFYPSLGQKKKINSVPEAEIQNVGTITEQEPLICSMNRLASGISLQRMRITSLHHQVMHVTVGFHRRTYLPQDLDLENLIPFHFTPFVQAIKQSADLWAKFVLVTFAVPELQVKHSYTS